MRRFSLLSAFVFQKGFLGSDYRVLFVEFGFFTADFLLFLPEKLQHLFPSVVIL
jgi:hypothetical protein